MPICSGTTWNDKYWKKYLLSTCSLTSGDDSVHLSTQTDVVKQTIDCRLIEMANQLAYTVLCLMEKNRVRCTLTHTTVLNKVIFPKLRVARSTSSLWQCHDLHEIRLTQKEAL